MARVLVIDDNDTMREGIAHTVRRMGHEVIVAASGRAGVGAFERNGADFIISDLKMEGLDGIGVLRTIREMDPEVPLMLVTGFGTVETAVEAMKLGAFDFVTKPFAPEVLRLKVTSALALVDHRQAREKLERHNEILQAELADRYRPVADHDLVGESAPLAQVLVTIARISAADSTVYVYGESGTGKELVARAIHRNSRRRSGPFIKVSCGALTETLLESELFGHEKGAFTHAHKRKLGRFELADQGTLFLDEIGDIGPAVQLKLLRVLQEREFERVGGESTIKVDVRIISATNKDLRGLVETGQFREDLFYRLHVVHLDLPPLRARPGDIGPLVEHFIDKLRDRAGSPATEATAATLDALRGYPWPGNVRELENAIEVALVFADGDAIEVADLPAHVRGGYAGQSLALPEDGRALPEILESLERQLILRGYEKAGGVKTECARILGIKTSALYYKLEKYGIGQ